jgi:hypothetical protein
VRRPCIVVGCHGYSHARGLCTVHYFQYRSGARFDTTEPIMRAVDRPKPLVCICLVPLPKRIFFGLAVECQRCHRKVIE